ncbi:hypothetical protein BD413DRAFT_632664 [Trametes elegans]|nr:hypothetical protein BD413DRAFT_632664 [Trametes elegans]
MAEHCDNPTSKNYLHTNESATTSVYKASKASHGYHKGGVRTTAPSVTASLVSGTTAQAQAVAAPVPATTSRNGRGVKVALIQITHFLSGRPRAPVQCTNCRSANKRCDDARPCPRCIQGGLRESCANAPPKPRRRRPVAAAPPGGPDIGVTSGASQAAFTVGLPAGAPDLDTAYFAYPLQYYGGELAGLPSLSAGSAPPRPANCSDDRAFTPPLSVAAENPSIVGQSYSSLAAHGACLGRASPAADLPSWLASAPQWAGPSADSSYLDFWGNSGASHAGMGSGETAPRSG